MRDGWPYGFGKNDVGFENREETGALFQSLDRTIQGFGEPIGSLEGYERLMSKAMNVMYANALAALRNGRSVVFDVGRWPWLMELASEADAKIEISYFEISAEERWRRVQKRNQEKPPGVYHWTMSRQEFDRQDPRLNLPDPVPGLKLIKVTE